MTKLYYNIVSKELRIRRLQRIRKRIYRRNAILFSCIPLAIDVSVAKTILGLFN